MADMLYSQKDLHAERLDRTGRTFCGHYVEKLCKRLPLASG